MRIRSRSAASRDTSCCAARSSQVRRISAWNPNAASEPSATDPATAQVSLARPARHDPASDSPTSSVPAAATGSPTRNGWSTITATAT